MVALDNAKGYDEQFWLKPIDETKGLSEMNSWKSKGKYVSKPLNRVNNSYDEAGPGSTKKVSSESSLEKNKIPNRKKMKANTQ